jgi:hypothetical protein
MSDEPKGVITESAPPDLHPNVVVVEVQAINPTAYAKRDLVPVVATDGSNEIWLLDRASVPSASTEPFKALGTDLAKAPRPALTLELVASLLPSAESVLLALVRSGIVSLEDAKDMPKVRRALNTVYPSATKFAHLASKEFPNG